MGQNQITLNIRGHRLLLRVARLNAQYAGEMGFS